MASIVTFSVIKVNSDIFPDELQTLDKNCDGLKPEGMAWLVPIKQLSRVVEYQEVLNAADDKPTDDSIRVVKVKDNMNGNTYFIPVNDDDTMKVFTDLCNGCCGDTPVLDPVAIPVPIVCSKVCANDAGVYVFDFPLPLNPNDLTYNISAVFNKATHPDSATELADAAAVLDFASTNYTDLDWTLTNGDTVLHAESNTVNCAGLNLGLDVATWCFTPPAGNTTADSFRINGVVSPFPMGQIVFSKDTLGTLIHALSTMLIGNLTIITGTPNKLQYTGLQLPQNLYNDDLAVASTTFAAGAC